MNKKCIPVLLVATAFLAACNKDNVSNNAANDGLPAVTKENAVAEVNGKYISKDALAQLEKDLAARARPGQKFPKDKLIEELVQRELLVEDALNKKLDKTEDFKKTIANIKNTMLTREAVQNYLKSNPVTDAELQAEYDKTIAKAGDEYKARHILVKTEAEAKKIIEQLKKGADFAELAKEKSTGPSAPQGGDLGWFASGQMVPPFSEAVIALEDNKFTTEPVQTQFGWHIILREGTRKQTPPPFESIKEQMRPLLQRKKIESYLESLRTNAKVEILYKPEAEKKPEAQKAKDEKPKVGDTLDATTGKVADSAKQLKENIATTAKDAAAKAAETVEQAKDSAKKTAQDAVDKAKEATEKAKQSAADATSKTINKLSDKTTKSLDALTK